MKRRGKDIKAISKLETRKQTDDDIANNEKKKKKNPRKLQKLQYTKQRKLKTLVKNRGNFRI